MLILAGVTASILINTGLLKNTKDAVQSYEKSEVEEKLSVAFAAAFSKSALKGEDVTAESLQEELDKIGIDAIVWPDDEDENILHIQIGDKDGEYTVDINTGTITDGKKDPDNPEQPTVDNKAPVITLASNRNTNWSQTASVNVSIVDSGSGLATGASIKYGWSTSATTAPTDYQIADISTYSEGSKNASFTATSAGLTGKYYLWVVPETLKDVAGNSQKEKRISTGTFYLDNTKPVVISVTTTSSDIILSATDEIGITGYAVTTTNTAPDLAQTGGIEGKDGVDKWISCSSVTAINNKKLTGYEQGTTYYVWTRDAAGNISSSKSGETGTGTITKPTEEDLKYTVTWSNTEPKATVSFTTTSEFTIQISTDGGATWKQYENDAITVNSGEAIYVKYAKDNTHGDQYIVITPILEYTIVYNGNGETTGSTENSLHRYNEEKVLTRNGYSKTGHTFQNWNTKQDGTGISYEDGAKVNNLAQVNGATVTLYAQWKEVPNPNTPYRVEHYQMDLDGNYPTTPTETENKAGTSNTVASSNSKNYTGFTENEAKRENVGANIAADGSLVIKYYYARNKYEYTVETVEGVTSTAENTPSGTYYYGTTIKLRATLNDGYTWSSWASSNTSLVENKSQINASFTMPAGAITMTPNASRMEYTITYHLDGGTLPEGKENPTVYTVTTAEITLTNPTRNGYTFLGWTGSNGQTPQTTVKIAPGSTGNRTYTANWQPDKQAIKVGDLEIYQVYGDGIYRDEDCTEKMTTTENPIQPLPTKDGYEFGGYYTEENGGGTQMIDENGYKTTEFTPTTNLENLELYPHWIKRGDVTYKIEHYKMGTNGSYPEKATETENRTGTTGETAESAPKTYEGFTENEAKREQVGAAIIADGSLVIKYYYERNKYDFILQTPDEGALITGCSATGKYYYEADINLAIAPETGYEFTGWMSSNPDLVGHITTNTGTFKMPAGSITMTAKIAPIEYKIEYDLAGGSLSEGVINPTSYTVTTTDISLSNPIRPGYTFLGWTGHNGETPETTVIISQGSTGNRKYIANWQAKTYQIEYDLAGGRLPEGVTNPTTYTTITGEITLNNPIKTGYTFLGWTGSNGTVPETTVKILPGSTEDRKYTANWQAETYAIKVGDLTIYQIYGEGIYRDETCTEKMTTTENPIEVPTRDGYEFGGYYTEENGQGSQMINENGYKTTEFTPTTNLENLELYPHWIKRGDVTYKVEHYKMGLNGLYPETATETENKTGTTGETATSTPKGYEGFTEDTSRREHVDEPIIADGSLVIKYYYERNKYKFTAESSEGVITTSTTEDGTYYYQADINLSAGAETGYRFTDWSSSNPDLVPNITTANTTFMMPAGDITMTANASIIEYQITYDLVGGTLTKENPATYNVKTKTFTLNNPTKQGYHFLGWTQNKEEEPTAEVTISQGSTGNKTYTANWEVISYEIKYEGIEGASFPNGNNPTSYTINTTDITLKAPAKPGYRFTGWTGSNGTTGQVNVTISQGSTGDKTYTANWEEETYNINYELNGGTLPDNAPNAYTVTSEEIILLNPTKVGYTFTGWTGSNGTTPQEEVRISQGSTGHKTYTANWQVNGYTFTLGSTTGVSTEGSTRHRYIYLWYTN